MLAALPSHPEILTANNGKRALSLLESEPVRLLICDLKMPRIDGLQILSIVRRRYPELRTVVLSALEDEEFRSRAYALGVDLFWIKMDMQRNSKLFIECLESLLGRDDEPGFRGIQSKSLMDIIQMECLSRSSSVLRITRGPLVAKLWIQDGELIDAEAEGANGEAAFRRILSWKSGTFENLPAEPHHTRNITKPVNAPAARKRAGHGRSFQRTCHARSRRRFRTSQNGLETFVTHARRRRFCHLNSARRHGRTRSARHADGHVARSVDAPRRRHRASLGRTSRSRSDFASDRPKHGTSSAGIGARGTVVPRRLAG